MQPPSQAPLTYAGTCTHMRLHTPTLVHTDCFTIGCCYTRRHLPHTRTDTCAHFYTLTFLHARERFDTRTLSHTAASAHPRLHTDALTHTRRQTNTQALLHADALTHRRFHTGAFAHARKLQKKLFVKISH